MLVTEVPAGIPSPSERVGRAAVTVVICPFAPVVTVVYTVACVVLCGSGDVVVVPVILADKC